MADLVYSSSVAMTCLLVHTTLVIINAAVLREIARDAADRADTLVRLQRWALRGDDSKSRRRRQLCCALVGRYIDVVAPLVVTAWSVHIVAMACNTGFDGLTKDTGELSSSELLVRQWLRALIKTVGAIGVTLVFYEPARLWRLLVTGAACCLGTCLALVLTSAVLCLLTLYPNTPEMQQAFDFFMECWCWSSGGTTVCVLIVSADQHTAALSAVAAAVWRWLSDAIGVLGCAISCLLTIVLLAACSVIATDAVLRSSTAYTHDSAAVYGFKLFASSVVLSALFIVIGLAVLAFAVRIAEYGLIAAVRVPFVRVWSQVTSQECAQVCTMLTCVYALACAGNFSWSLAKEAYAATITGTTNAWLSISFAVFITAMLMPVACCATLVSVRTCLGARARRFQANQVFTREDIRASVTGDSLQHAVMTRNSQSTRVLTIEN